MRTGRPVAALVLLPGLLTACSGSGPAPEASSSAATGQPPLPRARATVGAVGLDVELATTPAQQAAGLRGRAVPPGTGMAFPYPGGRTVRFTMAGVTTPLAAAFALGGRVVSVEALQPCPGTVAQCPSYGPATVVDLVVETAAGGLAGVAPGDPVALQR